jgi:hypothetical protein
VCGTRRCITIFITTPIGPIGPTLRQNNPVYILHSRVPLRYHSTYVEVVQGCRGCHIQFMDQKAMRLLIVLLNKFICYLNSCTSANENMKIGTMFWNSASCSSSVHIRTTRRYILEDGNIHKNRCENLKSCIRGSSLHHFLRPPVTCPNIHPRHTLVKCLQTMFFLQWEPK